MKRIIIALISLFIGIIGIIRYSSARKKKRHSNNEVIFVTKDVNKSKSENIESKSKGNISRLINQIVILLVGPILTAIIADVMIEHSMKKISEKESLNNQTKTFESLYIGCSKEWIDERLGVPTFEYTIDSDSPILYNEKETLKDDLLGCVYNTDIAILRAFFKKDDLSCKAFFVTTKNENAIKIPKPYCNIIHSNEIGNFSYYDIMNYPVLLGGFFTNGTGRLFYGEVYYYYSGGNYYNFSFATLDYGLKKDIDLIVRKPEEFEFDDKINKKNCKIVGWEFIKDRKKGYPNTYGITDRSISSDITWDLLSDYNGFDSNQLRTHDFLNHEPQEVYTGTTSQINVPVVSEEIK